MTATRPRGIDDVLREARAQLERLDPCEAYEAVRAGAVLVDIRPQLNREAEGEIPGALVIERNVLEWRLDPAGDLIGGYLAGSRAADPALSCNCCWWWCAWRSRRTGRRPSWCRSWPAP